MRNLLNDPVIVAALRTPISRAFKGSFAHTRSDDLAAEVIQAILKKVPQLDSREIDDVIIGCAMPEAEQGMNMARIISFRAGLPETIPAMTVNRFCSSGLQTIAIGASNIMSNWANVVLAGGVESMSMIPMGGNDFRPNPYLADTDPDVYLSMGLTAENLVERYKITREEQDYFSLLSHQKAVAAIDGGKFVDEIAPIETIVESLEGIQKKVIKKNISADEGPRRDTSMDTLARLKPAFKKDGTVTAGNSSQMSDGAAVAFLMSRYKAMVLGLKPLARFVSYAVAGVRPEIMGVGPVYAIPKALNLAGLKIRDIGLIELNEAFACQCLAVLEELENNGLAVDLDRVNVNGGAVALGHPLGCTGARMTATLLHEMRKRNVKYGMVTMCIGGGMGAAGILELEE